MRESFPELKEGDVLGAGYMNRMAGAVGRVVRFSPQQGYHGGSLLTEVRIPPFQQAEFIVTDETNADDRLYSIARRYYNSGAGIWEQENEEWELDALPKVVRLLGGDLITAYWDELRGAFVPCWVPTRRKAVISQVGGIIMMGSGEVTFVKNGALTNWKELAYFNWVYGDDLNEGQRVFVQYYYDESKWVIEIPWC